MKRRNFVQIAAGASLGAGFVPLFAVKGETGDRFQPFYTNPQIRRFGDCRDWFFEKRFGMFVHWGLYAIPGWHEQH
ncbi:MAG: alpha-L-fucosidase, partial [Bacteroidales bacterium]